MTNILAVFLDWRTRAVKLNIFISSIQNGKRFSCCFLIYFVNSMFCGQLTHGEAYSPKSVCSLLSVSCLSFFGSTFCEFAAKIVQDESNAKENLFFFHCRAATYFRIFAAKIVKNGDNRERCE